jgi:drug/metabolite transporter (DMT)-like permease
MSLTSLMLLLVAAVLHAAANVLMKQARDKLAFIWWVLGASVLLWSPALVYVGGPSDGKGWTLVIVSGLLEAIYFYTLSRAYALGDLSLVYPLARGSAPLFILAWARLILDERPSAVGVAGVLTIVLGMYLINLPSLADWRRPLAGFQQPAARWALVTGLLISGYAAVDKVGVKYVPPVAYLVLFLAVAWLVLAGQWLNPGRRQALREEVGAVKGRSRWEARGRIVGCAIVGNSAYLCVLLAMRQSPVSYIGAVREVSVVIGAWIGVQLLGERGGMVRVIASGLIVAGIFLIALRG